MSDFWERTNDYTANQESFPNLVQIREPFIANREKQQQTPQKKDMNSNPEILHFFRK